MMYIIVGASSLAAGHKTLVSPVNQEIKKNLGRSGYKWSLQEVDTCERITNFQCMTLEFTAIFGPGTVLSEAACTVYRRKINGSDPS